VHVATECVVADSPLKVSLMSIAILAENVSAIPRAILALKSIDNTVGDTLKVSSIPAIAILLLRY